MNKSFNINLSEEEINWILSDTYNENKNISQENLNKIIEDYLRQCIRDSMEEYELFIKECEKK